MNIRFYLKSTKEDNTPTPLFATVSYAGNVVKVYPGESILPKHWNPATQSARKNFPESFEFNQRLNNFRSKVGRIFRDYRNINDDALPAERELKALIKYGLNKSTATISFLSYFSDFIKRTKQGKRINHRDPNKGPVGTGIIRGYQTTFNHLKDFAKRHNVILDFDSIDLKFYGSFTQYLQEIVSLRCNTIGSHFRRIKTVLSEATEEGVNSNLSFKKKGFAVVSEPSDNIYITESEQMELLNLNLNPGQDLARDWFLIACNTGLRYSDFSRLSRMNVKGDDIVILTQKTKKDVVIPILPIMRKILDKRNGDFPPRISDVEINREIKKIGKEIPSLSSPVMITYTKSGIKKSETVNRYTKLATHTGRRSFLTVMREKGVPNWALMQISGHKTEKSFNLYMKLTSNDGALEMKRILSLGENKLKAV